MDKSYKIDMMIDMDGLTGQPDGATAQQVFFMMVMQTMLAYGKQTDGFDLVDQKYLREIRKAMEESLKTKETNFIISIPAFGFLNQCRHKVKLDPSANEAIFRANELIDSSEKEFEKIHGKPESPEEKKPE